MLWQKQHRLKIISIMAYNEKLADRIRVALADLPKVEEKKMFGGLAFMVDDKMCINVGMDRIMCRIDPVLHDEALSNKGARTVIMKGREYRGFIHVAEHAIKTKKELNYWIELSVDYNKHAKSSKKK
jgi:TfoX/Sxy family transcriptional regulator of competence genes